MGVNIPILELYGMSESTGSHSVNLMGGGRWRVGSAGQALVGTEMKIHCPDENGDGEVDFALIFKKGGVITGGVKEIMLCG